MSCVIFLGGKLCIVGDLHGHFSPAIKKSPFFVVQLGNHQSLQAFKMSALDQSSGVLGPDFL